MQFNLFRNEEKRDSAVAELLKLQLRTARYHKYLEHYIISVIPEGRSLRTGILKALEELQYISGDTCMGLSKISSLDPLKKAKIDFNDYFRTKLKENKVESGRLELKSRLLMLKGHYRLVYGTFIDFTARFEIGEDKLEEISELYVKSLIVLQKMETMVDQFNSKDDI